MIMYEVNKVIAVFDEAESRTQPFLLFVDDMVTEILRNIVHGSAEVRWSSDYEGVLCSGYARPEDVAALRDAAYVAEHEMATPQLEEAATLRELADELELGLRFSIVKAEHAWAYYTA
jgi:hypothetical protein